jgi:catechol 2,3-dioxygenase-like lactoylglutathione lyase family enzyme
MTGGRRHDRLGVHSIGEFLLTVPALDEAQRFYAAFGLDARMEDGQLALRCQGDAHVWGRLRAGAAKKLERLIFHCFADELQAIERRWAEQGVQRIAAAEGAQDALWARSPDGLAICVRPGVKTTPDAVPPVDATLPRSGERGAPYRNAAPAVRPRRLSHIALLTRSVPGQIDFFSRALGLRLSDRSGDNVAFLHGPHGSDHHLVALLGSSGPGLHHLSWDVPSVDEVGLGAAQMAAAGYSQGWGVGRHVLGSNYFHYAQDPWGSF